MGNRATLTFLNAGHFLIHYFMLIFPTAVIAIEKEWNLSYGNTLLFSTPSFAAFAIASSCLFIASASRAAFASSSFFR